MSDCTSFNNKVENGICLFVPKIHPRFNWRAVKGVFIRCNFGYVEKVNLFRNGYFKSAVIIFRAGSWNTRTPLANKVLMKFQEGESIRIKPDDEKADEFPDEFWMVFVNSQDRNKSVKAPRPKIEFVPKTKVETSMSLTHGSPDESVSTPPNSPKRVEEGTFHEEDLDDA